MRARVGKRLSAAALGMAASLCLGAPAQVAQDTRIEQWLLLLEETPLPVLRADAALAQAARREGLAPPAGQTRLRRQLLARVFPHIVFPDSAVEQMTLAEEFVHSHCPQEREPAQGKAWARYAALAGEVPDSLLPPWESLAPFLRSAEMQDMPACRAKLLVMSSPGAFQEDCSDPPTSERHGSGEDATAAAEEALPWSPGCLQIRPSPPGACLVLARDGKNCQLKVEEFDSLAGEFRIPAQGTLAEGRADLLRVILGQSFHRPASEASGRTPAGQGGREGTLRNPGTPVRFLAASDSSLLDAPGGKRWANLHLEDLPAELRPLRDSVRFLKSPVQRKTRYGHFRIDFGKPAARPAQVGQALLGRVEALAQALGRKPAFLEKRARLFYTRWDALYRHPDTLDYSLWLSPSSALDTAACEPVPVRSTGILNDIDSLAWRYSAGKKTDTLLGPFQAAYGTVWMRIRGKTRGGGKVPFPSARESIRMHMARSMVLGSALGLLQHPILSEADIPRNALYDVPLPRFKDKGDLIDAVIRLKYGRADAGNPQRKEIESFSERMLMEMYRVHKQERDLAAWMDGLRVTPEAERFGIRL